jgi:hypothetical protein
MSKKKIDFLFSTGTKSSEKNGNKVEKMFSYPFIRVLIVKKILSKIYFKIKKFILKYYRRIPLIYYSF